MPWSSRFLVERYCLTNRSLFWPVIPDMLDRWDTYCDRYPQIGYSPVIE